MDLDWTRDVFTQGQTLVWMHPTHLAARLGDLCRRPYAMNKFVV